MALVDYEYYLSKYNNLDAEEFYSIEPSAEDYVRNNCRKSIYDSIVLDEADYRHNRIKDAICIISDTMFDLKDNQPSKGIAAISNNGYSESYMSGFSKDQTLKSVLFSSLTGTGLMGAL